jgi:L-ascorbate metabolism protein UlaG (beta-lactamase superfamily)
MLLTKHGHACVRIEDEGRVLVIDPGTLTDAAALAGATAVLITHEHEDHVDIDKLRAARQANPSLTIHAHADLVAEFDEDAIPVASGDIFISAGFTVRAVGGEHAEIIDGLPGCANLGFIVDGLYHPGDSFFVPAEAVDTLLVPCSGPWLKLGEAIEFTRAVRPARAFPIHDAHLSDIGLASFDWLLEAKGGAPYARIPVGESVTV